MNDARAIRASCPRTEPRCGWDSVLHACAAAECPQRNDAQATYRDSQRYRWLRGEVQGPHLPLAQVVWKLHGIRDSSNWTNLADGRTLDEHIDEAIACTGVNPADARADVRATPDVADATRDVAGGMKL